MQVDGHAGGFCGTARRALSSAHESSRFVRATVFFKKSVACARHSKGRIDRGLAREEAALRGCMSLLTDRVIDVEDGQAIDFSRRRERIGLARSDGPARLPEGDENAST